ncbi:quinoprotein dehydrogenase-associated SoxYZ-like carrier [Caldimonas tepidiphila]|uniref:quinoprotein dehydrogenase-associated SoxYZ-like carrier n=1 Tax=Caldimonas tepidiphila TaxID=2315841 RepID=UPI000E5AB856|nr:quinoprotein dehydrogenase-associated SoxYZ-like carrier [Caldimonas tepidiphila]
MSLSALLARPLAALLLCALSLGALAQEPDPQASPRWQQLRERLFKDRSIETGSAVVTLEAPARAADAALVPLAVRAQFPQGPSRRIERLWLVVDSNPSPVAALFRYGPASGRADVATRVRIDEYTFVRAIAETDDGRLHMAVRYVKASGGCSAPPAKDAQAARATLGQMRLRVHPPLPPGEPAPAQLLVRHPNHSGMAMDPLTRQYEPAHFVRSVEVSYRGRPVLSAELDFSISENPHLRFFFVPQQGGELRAEAVDSQDRRFEAALDLDRPER